MTTSANTSPVDVRGPRKQCGDVTAVDGIGLAIRRGEVFGLLGPDGAGNTTAVEILRGNRDRDGGEVSVPGAEPARAHARGARKGHRLGGRIGARGVDVPRDRAALRPTGQEYAR